MKMIKTIVYILIIMSSMFLYLRYYEFQALYHPVKEIGLIPTQRGLSYEDVYIDTDDGARINAWFIPAEDSKYTLLFSHGNAGNIGDRLDKLLMLNEMGLDIFIYDYRGYGKSSGRPSEHGLYKDIDAVYNYLIFRKNIPAEQIMLYGESLGGAVAIDLASRKKVGGLIIESTFSSVKDMAKVAAPFFPAFLAVSGFDSASKIRKITVPKLIIYSKDDEVIPFTQTEKLFRVSEEPKKRLVLKGRHSDLDVVSKDRFITGISEFIRDIK